MCILKQMIHDMRTSASPAGEQPPIERGCASAPTTLDSWAGPVRVEWDSTAPLTPYGQFQFFIEYLKVAGLFDGLVADCPLAYTSANAPEKRDVLGIEEPMGVDRLHHPRSRPLPAHGPLHRAHLQLVEPVSAPRQTGQTSAGRCCCPPLQSAAATRGRQR